MNNNSKPHLANGGAGYFIKGFELIRTPGIRRFVFIPLSVNLVLFSYAFYYMFLQLEGYMLTLEDWLGDSFAWLSNFIWPLAILFILVVFSFIFSSVANWLAAPFNGLLSEKIEALLTDKPLHDGSAFDVVKDIPRTLSREVSKLGYYLPRAAGFFLLYWILPVVGQILWLSLIHI